MADSVDRTRGIGWLHLSDLQVGQDGAAIEVPEVRGLLEKDLRRIHDASGPWNFVAISGNVTATGAVAEYAHAMRTLEWLWECLHVLGSEPALVMVPGPRDLDLSTQQRGVITSPSTLFVAFAEDLERRLRLTYSHAGVLPGDSARVITHGDLRVSVLGLSTSVPGHRLGHIRPFQLARAFGAQDIATWVRGNDAVIIVSHHAGDWLDAESAGYVGEIDAPVLALCGAHPDGPSAPSSCNGRQLVLPALPLARFEPNSFRYRAGRMMILDEQPTVRDWIRQLGAVAGTSSLGPQVTSAVDADGSTTIGWLTDPTSIRPRSMVTAASLEAQVRHIAWSPLGDRVAVIIGQGMLAIHDRHGERVQFPVHNSTPCAIAWNPAGDVLATRSRFHSRVWSADGVRQAEVPLTCPSPMALTWIAPDKLLLGSDDGVHYWESPGESSEPPSEGSGRWLLWMSRSRPTPILQLGKGVLALAFSPMCALAAVGTDDGIWLVVMDSTGKVKMPGDRLDQDAAHALAWSPGSSIFASGSTSGIVRVWDAASRTRLARLEGLTDTVRSLSFSRDGRLLAATAIDGSYRVWSCNDWTLRSPSAMRGIKRLEVIAFSPTADVVALGRIDGLRVELVQPDEEPAVDDEPVVRTTSAKVVLLGEGNAGKSCLALRLTQDRYEELGSTHGMKFWSMPLERLDPEAEIPPGERREVVFWDMGGQHEYQLLHHAFLHDTMLALMVMEPRRGEAALRELDVWDRQLTPDRSRIKRILIGSKLDDERVPRDPALVSRALAEHGFSGYAETSAKTGAGIEALRKAIARGVDWTSVAVTVRPQLFHRIRHYIDLRRTARRAVLPYHELEDIVKQREGDDVDLDVVGAVVEQLARQGVIADARLGDGSRMLILEIEQVERYAASLILAARDNPRGVPALEMASVGSVGMSFPRIAFGDRLPRDQELVVLECVVDLLIKSGICFASGRLLIFPALFRSHDGSSDPEAAYGATAVAYDFSARLTTSILRWCAGSHSIITSVHCDYRSTASSGPPRARGPVGSAGSRARATAARGGSRSISLATLTMRPASCSPVSSTTSCATTVSNLSSS